MKPEKTAMHSYASSIQPRTTRVTSIAKTLLGSLPHLKNWDCTLLPRIDISQHQLACSY